MDVCADQAYVCQRHDWVGNCGLLPSQRDLFTNFFHR